MDLITDKDTPWIDSYIKETLGQKVAFVQLDSARNVLSLGLQDGRVYRFEVEGDCCSHSWIEHLEAPSDLEGATILGWASRELVEGIDTPHDNYLQVYNTVIRTTAGDVVMEFRNESNGYYGGYLQFMGCTSPANDNGTR